MVRLCRLPSCCGRQPPRPDRTSSAGVESYHRDGRLCRPDCRTHPPARLLSGESVFRVQHYRRNGMEAALIIIGVLVVLVVVLVLIYNGLVTKRNRIDEANAQIQVQLKRRHDLIPNLVNAVKGYMDFEKSVLLQVTQARANAVAAGAQGVVCAGPGRERPDGRSPLALRGSRELPAAQGQRERPGPAGAADHDREPDLLLAPALQRFGPGLQQRHPDLPERPDRRAAGLHQARLLRGRAGSGRGPVRQPGLTASGPRRRLPARLWPLCPALRLIST